MFAKKIENLQNEYKIAEILVKNLFRGFLKWFLMYIQLIFSLCLIYEWIPTKMVFIFRLISYL